MSLFPDARILEIDLTNEKIQMKSLPGDTYRLYPGGSALGLYLLLREVNPEVDPLSPENMLVFSVSPLTGLPISGQSRMVVTTKSPLTGGIGDSQSGGFFPAALKSNGWDAIAIKGKARQPVYLYIEGEKVQLRPAAHFWGKVTGETEKAIKVELGEQALEIAQIGPAGENLVKYACIVNMCSRANGRTGTGAVMGSKNLKAVVVRKAKSRAPYDKERFLSLTKDTKTKIEANVAIYGLGTHGTAGILQGVNEAGFLPTRNWLSSYFPEGADKITGSVFTETILANRETCYACAIRCKRAVEIPNKVQPLYGGPEYETCAAFGSYCGITNIETIALANQLCNMYGLDTISCGATISFAMECYEQGLIDLDSTGGLELTFGNDEVLPRLIEMIAKRQGFGSILAEGSWRAAKLIGKGAETLSITVKGNELPAHMPQFKPALGLIYALNPFGPDHQSSEHDTSLIMPADSQERLRLAQIGIWKGYDTPYEIDEEKVRFAFDSQCFVSLLDTLCLCQFAWGLSWQLFGPTELVELCRAGIGWDTSLFELMRVGERRINMMRHFNAKAGFTREDDRLPARIFSPLPDGPAKGISVNKVKFAQALDIYYSYAGWDAKTGNPTEATLRKLSLGWLL